VTLRGSTIAGFPAPTANRPSRSLPDDPFSSPVEARGYPTVESPTPRRAAPPEPRRPWALILGGAAAVLVAVGVGAFFALRPANPAAVVAVQPAIPQPPVAPVAVAPAPVPQPPPVAAAPVAPVEPVKAPPPETAVDRRRAEQEKAAQAKAEKAERERLAREEKADRAAQAKAERERAAQEKADRARAEREARAEQDRAQRAEREKGAADRAAQAKAAAEKAAADKAAQAKAAQERAAGDRAAAERAAADKAAADKAAAEKAAAEKARLAAVAPPPAPVKRKGLDAAEVRSVIARTGPAFDECVRAAGSGPDASYVGRSVDLYVEVAPTGNANDAFIDDDGLANSNLGKCLKRAAMKMSFTPYDGEPVPVRVPLRLGQK